MMNRDATERTDRQASSRRVRADALQRAEAAWELRVAGATWAQVAESVGFSNPENAMRCVREALGSFPDNDRDELRALWRQRLERLWQRALEDVTEGRPGALVAGVRVIQAAARLDGLDAPSEFVLHTPTEREIDEWVAVVTAQQVTDIEEDDIFADDVRVDPRTREIEGPGAG